MKRFVSVLLALTMIVSFTNISSAATGRAALNITMKYETPDPGVGDVKSILTGGNANIKVSATGGTFTPSKPPLISRAQTGWSPSVDFSFLKISQLGNNEGWTIEVPESPFHGDILRGEATLSLQGDYTALISSGNVTEKPVGSDGMTNDLTMDGNLAVSGTNNQIILRVRADGPAAGGHPTTSGNPTFEVVPNSASGVFEGYDTVNIIGTVPYDYNDKDSEAQLDKRPMKFKLSKTPVVSGGVSDREFSVEIKQHHRVQKVDASGNPMVDPVSGDPIMVWNNFMEIGTTFTLSLIGPTSNELLLNVLTPEYAVEQISTEIFNAKTSNDRYIKLDSGNDGDYITEPFTMCNRVSRYSENYFNIQWAWEPNNPADQSVIRIAPGAGDNWAKAALERKVDDVRGNLVATVYYREGKTDEIKGQPVKIPILVYGTGKPATLEQYSHTIGASGEIVFSDPTIPNLKNMNIYDGNVSVLPQPADPYEYKLRLNMGLSNAASRYAKVEYMGGDKDVLEFSTMAGSAGVNYDPYKIDSEIANPMKDVPGVEGTALLRMRAKKVGTISFKIVYYVQSRSGGTVPASVQPRPMTVKVIDTSPNDDATLSKLNIKRNTSKNNNIAFEDFKFDPATKVYDLSMPYETNSVVLTPYRTDLRASENMKLYATRVDENGAPVVVVPEKVHKSGMPTDPIDLYPNSSTKVEITVTAENPNITETYTLNIRREPPSDDGSLKSLEFFDEEGKNWLTGFDSKIFNYTLEVPYNTKMLRVIAKKNYETAFDPNFDPKLDYKNVPFVGKAEWFKLKYDKNNPNNNSNVMKVTVMPENNQPVDMQTYIVNVSRLDPGTDSKLKSLTVADSKEKALTFTPAFSADAKVYELKIPYSTDKIKLKATMSSPTATMVLMDASSGKKLEDLKDDKYSSIVEVPTSSEKQPYYELQVLVTAEDEFSNTGYMVRIMREPPSTDATLSSLALNGGEGESIAGEEYGYVFDPETHSYSVKVPYEIEKVTVTPTTKYTPVSSLTVNGKKATSGTATSSIPLEFPGQTKLEVEVVAEDGKTKITYSVNITRETPSSDARLKALSVGGGTAIKPVFIPTTLEYTSSVDVGGKSVTINAVPNSSKATVTIDGQKVANGAASGPIDILAIEQKVVIVVTAQDGRTQMTYVIQFTNENLIEKSSNADLSSLKVNYGSIIPQFKPAIYAYEVAVKEDTHSIDILANTADRYAKMQVFSGSKEIGDFKGNFSSAIKDGLNAFSIKVTSHDETKENTYTINVYRNQEDKLQYLTPIKAEDINFETAGEIIVVDITKYTRVAADVFNTLKEEYPEKTIIFEGNDYSIQFKGVDIAKIVPSTEIFDFAMSFSSPEEEAIERKIDSREGNNDYRWGDVVYVYFAHHGALPAPAVFNLSLGGKYSDETLYWHYYNTERKRIDYYGKMNTNSKGTFALKLEHLSTYIITRKHRIVGSENKDGGALSMNMEGDEEPDLVEEVWEDKSNPGTGTGEETR